jgi:transposase
VESFDAFTPSLEALANWLEQCGVDTVAMESTGVYWIPLYELLEARGFQVLLVDTRQIKFVPGRKTDFLDCQWIQELHTFGLLRGAFRPAEEICTLRAYVRQRAMLIREGSKHIQHMQKALEQMNIKLAEVLREVTGRTGMAIINAILRGERDAHRLAELRHGRCKNSQATIAKALEGNWREEHLFQLQQAVDLWRYYQSKLAECDARIEQLLGEQFDSPDCELAGGSHRRLPKRRNELHFDGRAALRQLAGVDLTAIEGIDELTALTIISEVGTDMSRWDTSKRFSSWLALCPGNNKTGGRNRSGRNRRSANRAAQALRIAAQTLWRSSSALGAFLRRKAAHRGKGVAIKATANKLAHLVYSMLKYGTEYVAKTQEYYEQQYRERRLANLKRHARQLGLALVEAPAPA